MPVDKNNLGEVRFTKLHQNIIRGLNINSCFLSASKHEECLKNSEGNKRALRLVRTELTL